MGFRGSGSGVRLGLKGLGLGWGLGLGVGGWLGLLGVRGWGLVRVIRRARREHASNAGEP